MAFYNTAHSKRVALNGDLSTKHYVWNFKNLSKNCYDHVYLKSRTFGFASWCPCLSCSQDKGVKLLFDKAIKSVLKFAF